MDNQLYWTIVNEQLELMHQSCQENYAASILQLLAIGCIFLHHNLAKLALCHVTLCQLLLVFSLSHSARCTATIEAAQLRLWGHSAQMYN